MPVPDRSDSYTSPDGGRVQALQKSELRTRQFRLVFRASTDLGIESIIFITSPWTKRRTEIGRIAGNT